MHIRQQIRDAVVTLLTGATNAGTNVYSMRVYPVGKGNLPAIIVYTKSEDAENDTIGNVNSLRDLELSIEIYVKQQTNPDAEIDAIAEQIEALLGVNCDLSGEAKFIQYTGIEIEHNGDGDNAFFVATLSYSIIYRVSTADAGVLT